MTSLFPAQEFSNIAKIASALLVPSLIAIISGVFGGLTAGIVVFVVTIFIVAFLVCWVWFRSLPEVLTRIEDVQEAIEKIFKRAATDGGTLYVTGRFPI